MKKIFFLILFLVSLKSFAQYPNKQTIGSDSTEMMSKGGLKGRIILWRFADTATASNQRIKQYPGALISVGNSVYVRDSTATHWLLLDNTGVSNVTIIDSSHIQICNLNGCDTITTNVTAQLVTILSDTSFRVCDTLFNCDTFYVSQTQFIQSIFDTTSIYNAIYGIYTYLGDTSFTNQFMPNFGVVQDTTVRINDSVVVHVYTDGTSAYDTSRIALTQENITAITNILNYIDSISAQDTTFINNLQTLDGEEIVTVSTDSLTNNDTLNFDFHVTGQAGKVLGTDGTNLQWVTPSAGGSTLDNTGSGYRLLTGDGALIKSVNHDLTLTVDSLTSGELTFKVDTSQIATQYDLTQIPNIDTTSLSNRINLKQDALTLTTTGTSGAATLIGATLNIPQYTTDISGKLNISDTAAMLNPYKNKVDSIWRTPGKDSIQFNISGRYHAIKDSTGAAAGGLSGTGVSDRITLWQNATTLYSDTSFRYKPALTIPGAIPAAGAAFNVTPTVTAAHNNDTLVGLYVKGTYVPGAFTGVTYFDYRADSDIVVNNVRIGGGLGLPNNTVIGRLGALGQPQSGSGGNVAIGQQALKANTSGSNNVAIGTNTMLVNITGSSNIAIGTLALAANTNSQNTAVGYQAMITNTSGTSNTALGYATLNLNSTGSNNTAVGLSALNKTTSSQNTGIGSQALQNNVGGANNTAVGYNAAITNTSGSDNVAIGKSALNSNSTGSGNVVIGGDFTGWQLTTSNNTIVGYKAGYQLTSGATNVFIGRLAGANVGTKTLSNKLYIANDSSATGTLIHGDFSTGQVQINPSAITPTLTATAALEVISTTRGLLPPRMTTTQKNAISSPAEGLIVYDLTLHKLCVYTGSAWETISSL